MTGERINVRRQHFSFADSSRTHTYEPRAPLKCRALRSCSWMNPTRRKHVQKKTNQHFTGSVAIYPSFYCCYSLSILSHHMLSLCSGCEGFPNRTVAKMSRAASRTESVGILGRTLFRHLHSLLWSGHACLCRGSTLILANSQTCTRRHHSRALILPDKRRYSNGPSCTANISVRFHVWKNKNKKAEAFHTFVIPLHYNNLNGKTRHTINTHT